MHLLCFKFLLFTDTTAVILSLYSNHLFLFPKKLFISSHPVDLYQTQQLFWLDDYFTFTHYQAWHCRLGLAAIKLPLGQKLLTTVATINKYPRLKLIILPFVGTRVDIQSQQPIHSCAATLRQTLLVFFPQVHHSSILMNCQFILYA